MQGICEKIKNAKNSEEAQNLLAAAKSFEFISPKTLRRAERLAEKRVSNFCLVSSLS